MAVSVIFSTESNPSIRESDSQPQKLESAACTFKHLPIIYNSYLIIIIHSKQILSFLFEEKMHITKFEKRFTLGPLLSLNMA